MISYANGVFFPYPFVRTCMLEMEQEHMEQLALRSATNTKPSTNSSKSSFGLDGKPLPAMQAPVTTFKRTSTNTSFSKSASLTGGVF